MNGLVKPDTAGKLRSILIVVSMVLVGLTLVSFEVEEAEGWETYSVRANGSNGHTGYAYYSTDDSIEYKVRSNSAYAGRYGYTSPFEYYRGWMGFQVPDFDDRTDINSIRLDYRIFNTYAGDGQPDYYIEVDLLESNPYLLEAEQCYYAIDDGLSIDSYFCTGTGTRSITITGSAFNTVLDMIDDGDDYIYFGFDGTGDFDEYAQVYYYHCYLRFFIDRSPPTTPIMGSAPDYHPNTELPITHTATDQPTPGTGGVEYQAGLFYDETSPTPYLTYEWTVLEEWNITGLVDGEQYFIRTKARDANGFESGWSDVINTTIDTSPPSVPILTPESEFSEGTSVLVNWSEAVDAGIGLSNYSVQRSTDQTFAEYDEVIYGPGNYSHQFDDCDNGVKYYFRVMANDSFGHWSEFSPLISTTMDDEAPSVPILMNEPVYTKGSNNTFQWYPAVDQGIGLDHYVVQISVNDTFLPGEIVEEITTDGTFTEFTNLSDAMEYHVRVSSVDRFGYRSDWSDAVWSIQDDAGPDEPGLISLMEYQMDGNILLEWEGSTDQGIGVGWYKVEWSTDPDMIMNVELKDHVLGQSITITDLMPDVQCYFRITAFDTFGTMGASEVTSTTLDSAPPVMPVLNSMPQFANGTSKLVSWSGSTDLISGLDHYLLQVFSSEDELTEFMSVRTTETEFEVLRLEGGGTYYYKVTAFDIAGNHIVSETISSTQDTEGPMVTINHTGPFGGDLLTIDGSAVDDLSGLKGVEISIDGGSTWLECALTTDSWLYPIASISSERDMAWIRAVDNVGNIGDQVPVTIDLNPPQLKVTSPSLGDMINGPVHVTGTISDPHLSSYSIYYKLSGNEEWEPVLEDQPATAISGILGTWLPTGHPDGDYLIMVVAEDMLGQSSMVRFNLTLNQASLSLGPHSITFSDVDPMVGDTVTISVTLSNLGGSDADDVSLEIYDNGVRIDSFNGLMVPAQGTETVVLDLAITGYHNITARATSDWYDTGLMTTAAKMIAEVPEVEEEPPEEGFMEDNGGILGLVSLIIAIIAILILIILTFVFRRERKEILERTLPPAGGPASMPPAPDMKELPEAGEAIEKLPGSTEEKKGLLELPPTKAEESEPSVEPPIPDETPDEGPDLLPAPAPVEQDQQPGTIPSAEEPKLDALPSGNEPEPPMQAAPSPSVDLPK